MISKLLTFGMSINLSITETKDGMYEARYRLQIPSEDGATKNLPAMFTKASKHNISPEQFQEKVLLHIDNALSSWKPIIEQELSEQKQWEASKEQSKRAEELAAAEKKNKEAHNKKVEEAVVAIQEAEKADSKDLQVVRKKIEALRKLQGDHEVIAAAEKRNFKQETLFQ